MIDGRPAAEVEPGVPLDSVEQVFGPALAGVRRFHALLARHGVERGLIGPEEVPRLWSRHLLNSAAVVPLLPGTGSVADVGSGAGLPGIVIAAMRPDLDVHLVEPMQRRVVWLREVVAGLGLPRVSVHQSRAEELAGVLRVDVVVARAVARLDRLVPWTAPLLGDDGTLLLLKGARVADELAAAGPVLRRSGAQSWTLHRIDPGGLGSPTAVVEIRMGATTGRGVEQVFDASEHRKNRARGARGRR